MDEEVHAFTVRLSDENYKWLRTEAFMRQVSMNGIINGLVSELRDVMENGAITEVPGQSG